MLSEVPGAAVAVAPVASVASLPSSDDVLKAAKKVALAFAFIAQLASGSLEAGRVNDAVEDLAGALDDLAPELNIIRSVRSLDGER